MFDYRSVKTATLSKAKDSRIAEVSPGKPFKNFSEEVHNFLGDGDAEGDGFSSFSALTSGRLVFSGVSKDMLRACRRKGFPSSAITTPWCLLIQKLLLCLNDLSGALIFMLRSNIKVNAPYPVECIDFPDLGTLGFILY